VIIEGIQPRTWQFDATRLSGKHKNHPGSLYRESGLNVPSERDSESADGVYGWAAWKAPVITNREISWPDSGWNRPRALLEEGGLKGIAFACITFLPGRATFAAYAKEMTENIKVLWTQSIKKWAKSLT